MEFPKCPECGADAVKMGDLGKGKVYECSNGHRYPKKNIPEAPTAKADTTQKANKRFQFTPYSDISFEELVKILQLIGLQIPENHIIFHDEKFQKLRRHFQTEVK